MYIKVVNQAQNLRHEGRRYIVKMTKNRKLRNLRQKMRKQGYRTDEVPGRVNELHKQKHKKGKTH